MAESVPDHGCGGCNVATAAAATSSPRTAPIGDHLEIVHCQPDDFRRNVPGRGEWEPLIQVWLRVGSVGFYVPAGFANAKQNRNQKLDFLMRKKQITKYESTFPYGFCSQQAG